MPGLIKNRLQEVILWSLSEFVFSSEESQTGLGELKRWPNMNLTIEYVK